jgi:hypothetical protein
LNQKEADSGRFLEASRWPNRSAPDALARESSRTLRILQRRKKDELLAETCAGCKKLGKAVEMAT